MDACVYNQIAKIYLLQMLLTSINIRSHVQTYTSPIIVRLLLQVFE